MPSWTCCTRAPNGGTAASCRTATWGRTELLASVAAMQTFGDTSVGLTARFPPWRHIVAGDEPQGSLSSPVMLSATVSRSFGRHH